MTRKSIRRLAAGGLVLVGLTSAACGGGGGSANGAAAGRSTRTAASTSTGTAASTSTGTGAGRSAGTQGPAAEGSFSWLRPGPAPAGWPIVRIPIGAAMAYPPGWRLVSGDPGTATAALFGAHNRYVGYLNLTPRQGSETLTNWPRFRVRHNAEEDERDIVTSAAGYHLGFRSGTGSCVRDAYTTSIGARYIELACLVAGSRASSVIVGAAPPGAWGKVAPLIERSINSFTS